MTFGEFKRLVDKHYGKMRIEYKPISYIPGHHTVCLHCKEKWALSDLETFVTSTRTLPVIDVVRLLGNKYSELMKRIIKGNDDSHVEIVKALNDLTGNFWIINKDNEKEPKLITSFTCCEHYHNKCNKERVDKISIETSKEFLKCFKEAEIAVYGLVRTKNIYGSENTKGPWFIFDTELGHMKLGWIINTPHVDAFALHKDFIDPEDKVFNLGKGFENGYDDVVKFLRIIKSKINKEKLNLPNLIDFRTQQSRHASPPHSM
jgi:hypothetical protein